MTPFQLTQRLANFALLAAFAVLLSACGHTTKYSYSVTDATGKTVESSFECVRAREGNDTCDNAGTVLALMPPGATVKFTGTITNAEAGDAYGLNLVAASCVKTECGGAASPSAATCANYDAKVKACSDKALDKSYSVTCPSQLCERQRYPRLTMDRSGTAKCACPPAAADPPLCTDSAALNEKNANGEPVWNTCTPVELDVLTRNANANDALLKKMMTPPAGGGSGATCRRVYNFVTHTYDCI